MFLASIAFIANLYLHIIADLSKLVRSCWASCLMLSDRYEAIAAGVLEKLVASKEHPKTGVKNIVFGQQGFCFYFPSSDLV